MASGKAAKAQALAPKGRTFERYASGSPVSGCHYEVHGTHTNGRFTRVSHVDQGLCGLNDWSALLGWKHIFAR